LYNHFEKDCYCKGDASIAKARTSRSYIEKMESKFVDEELEK